MEDANWSEWDSKENRFCKHENIASRLVYGEIPPVAPRFSIVIPTYRRAGLLETALLSAIRQENAPEYEILVVDNSEDADEQTDALLYKYVSQYPNIRYYRNGANLGMFGNWNRGLLLARTPWVCLLHDDDALKPNYLETVSAALDKLNETCGMLGVFHEKLDQREADERRSSAGSQNTTRKIAALLFRLRRSSFISITSKDMMRGISVMVCAAVYNRSLAMECGGFDDQYGPNGDLVFFAKIVKYAKIIVLPQNLCYYRIEDNASMKVNTAKNIVAGVYHLTVAMAESLQIPPSKGRRLGVCRAIIADDIVSSYCKEYTPSLVCDQIELSNKFMSPIHRTFTLLLYKFRWGFKFLF